MLSVYQLFGLEILITSTYISYNQTSYSNLYNRIRFIPLPSSNPSQEQHDLLKYLLMVRPTLLLLVKSIYENLEEACEKNKKLSIAFPLLTFTFYIHSNIPLITVFANIKGEVRQKIIF